MAVKEILRAHGDDLRVDELASAIDAVADCAAHCNACADACLEHDDMDMTQCIRACADCADICQATAAVLARAGRSGAPWTDLAQVCLEAVRNCAEECAKHDNEHCAACERSCRRTEEALEKLLSSV